MKSSLRRAGHAGAKSSASSTRQTSPAFHRSKARRTDRRKKPRRTARPAYAAGAHKNEHTSNAKHKLQQRNNDQGACSFAAPLRKAAALCRKNHPSQPFGFQPFALLPSGRQHQRRTDRRKKPRRTARPAYAASALAGGGPMRGLAQGIASPCRQVALCAIVQQRMIGKKRASGGGHQGNRPN